MKDDYWSSHVDDTTPEEKALLSDPEWIGFKRALLDECMAAALGDEAKAIELYEDRIITYKEWKARKSAHRPEN